MSAQELVKFVKDKTTIGGSGKYLEELFKAGRFFVFELPERGFQPQFGAPVVTTSHPSKDKELRLPELVELIEKKKSFLFLIGLGHKGLPAELFDMAKHHLDITSKGVSLETCTAIGAVPAAIAGCAEKRERK